MKIKTMGILLIMVTLLLSISFVSAAEINETEDMSCTNEMDDIICSDPIINNFDDLREAAKVSNQVINLNSDIVRGDSDNAPIGIYTNNITINGNGHTIDSISKGRIFSIYEGGELTLINVKLINGNGYYSNEYNNYDGGAILNKGKLTLIDCTFENNYARTGGAIASFLATVTLKGTNVFSKNRADNDGGAICNHGGSTFTSSGKTIFDSNTAITNPDSKAGAILNAFSNSKLQLTGESVFTNNKASQDGGAIFNHQALAIIEGTNSFIKNEATSHNGATTGKGGAINNENATFYLSGDNTFDSNVAYRGGAIDNSLFQSTFTISGKNKFVNNRATMGGAIANQEARNLIISGSNTFESNTANYDGRGGGGPNIGGAIFSFKSGFTIDAVNTFARNTAAGSGGAIYISQGNAMIKGQNSFNSNSAPIGGALLLIDANRVDLAGENVFSSNTASSSGGAIRANNVKELIISNHNYFSNNKADHSGGAIYMQNSALNVQGTLFEANSAIYGGAIFLENTAFLANYDIFKNNHAGQTGADIEFFSGSIVSLDYNYWNSQNKVSQNNIHNYAVSNINNWAVLDLTIPSQIETDGEVEVLRFKNNNGGGLGGEMPMYGVDVTPNFNPTHVIITRNVGKSTYVGRPGQVTVNAASSNFGASRVVNAVEGKLQTSLSGNNVLLTDPTQSATYVVTLSDAKGNKLSGKAITITVDSQRYDRTTDNQGKASLTLSNLANGYHEISTNFAGEGKYYASSATNGIICIYSNQSSTKLTGNDMEMYYKDGSRYEVTLSDANGRPMASKDVKFYISGAIYSRTTDANGKASIAINLNSGEHNALACYPGANSNEFSYVENTIKIKPTIYGEDIVKYYKNATQYYAKFLDKNGNPLKNSAVSFNINGVFYTRNTNDQGVARMNINLNPGTYIITAQNPENGEMHSNKVTVLGVLVAKDLTKYYRNDSQYSIQVLGGDGKPIGEGVKVKFNINGVFYERVTNASGIAKLNINLNPDTYIITAEYNGLMHSNTIKVLPVLYANNINMKYKDGTRFKVKLVDGQGKAYANQTIQLNVNGVFYYKVTGADGYASLAINLMPGQYIITSAYETAMLSNKITINS